MTRTINTLLSLLLLLPFIVKSQKSNAPIQIGLDFNSKTFNIGTIEKLKKIKKGEFYQLKISNINLNLYNISTTNKDSILSSTVSLPSFGSIGLDALNAVVGGIKVNTSSAIKEKDSLANLESTLSTVNKIDVLVEIATNMPDTIKEKEELEKKIKQIKELLQEKEQSPKEKIIQKINALSEEVKQIAIEVRDRPLTTLDALLLDINAQINTYYLVDTTSKYNCSTTQKDPCDFLIQVNNYRTILIKYKSDLNKQLTDLDEYIKKLEGGLDEMKKDSALRSDYAAFKATISKATTAIDKALETISQDKVTLIMQTLIHLDNNASSNWRSLPIQYMGDIGQFTIKIAPKKPEYGLSTYDNTYHFPIPKHYAGVSVGFYHAFSFVNESFSTLEKVIDTTSEFNIVKEDTIKGEIGFTTLLHFGSKIGDSPFGIHFSVGPAISLSSSPKPRLCLGGGLSYGKTKNMLSIDFLAMGGYTDKKSNAYNESITYSKKPEQVTVSKLSSSFALSVGYIYKF